jgi:membrane protein implicated in regulation of membrane protease activity
MSAWIVWLVVAAGFGIGEMLSTGFFLAPFAFGGAAAALVDAVGAGEGAAVVVFAVISILSLALVRPLLRSRLSRNTPTLRTGAQALIGRRAIVLERIDNHQGLGSVKIDGDVWTARSLDDEHEIEPGKRVEVVDIRGATALVME